MEIHSTLNQRKSIHTLTYLMNEDEKCLSLSLDVRSQMLVQVVQDLKTYESVFLVLLAQAKYDQLAQPRRIRHHDPIGRQPRQNVENLVTEFLLLIVFLLRRPSVCQKLLKHGEESVQEALVLCGLHNLDMNPKRPHQQQLTLQRCKKMKKKQLKIN